MCAKKVAKILGLSEADAFELDSNAIYDTSTQVDILPLADSTEVQGDKNVVSINLINPNSVALPTEIIPSVKKGTKLETQIFFYVKLFSFLIIAAATVFLVMQLNHPAAQINTDLSTALVVPSAPDLKQDESSATNEFHEEKKNIQATDQIPVATEKSRELVKTALRITECTLILSSPQKYTSLNASKEGNQVYLVSKTATSVCFEDADGNQQKKELVQDAGISFFGKAPLKLGSNNLGQLDIFYQGYKVRVDLSSKAIQLTEKSLN
jgi:hypothetical protein